MSAGPGLSASRFRWLTLTGMVAFCGLLYGYTLSYPFLFDDYIYLLENPLVREGKSFGFPGHFQEFATSSKRLGLDPDLSVNFILRPITYLTFYLNFLCDGWNPRGFRAVNLCVHAVNGFLICELLTYWVCTSGKEIRFRISSARFVGLSGGFLFLAHPLAIESVTYIVQRFTSLATLFYLLVLIAYFRANTARTENAATVWRAVSLVGLIVGMLSKEILFTAPFLMIVLDCVVMGSSFPVACKRAIPHLLCLPIIPILMVLTSAALSNDGLPMASALFVADPTSSPQYQYYYAITQFGVILTYLRMILVPAGLNLDPDYPRCESIWEFQGLGAALLILTLLGSLGWWYLQQKNDLRRALIFGGTIWYFLGLSIDSSIVPLPDFMAEHRSYFPSIGALVALACSIDFLRTRWAEQSLRWRFLVPIGMVLWILSLGWATVVRHQVWSSEIAMWKDVVAKSPKKSRVWTNLGASYLRAKRLKEANECFIEQLRISPNNIVGYINLATVQATMGRNEEALKTVSAGSRFASPRYEDRIYYLLGRIWLGLGELQKSIVCAERVVALKPQHAEAHCTLMDLYFRTAQLEKALEHGRIASELKPGDGSILADLRTIEAALTRRKAAGGPAR